MRLRLGMGFSWMTVEVSHATEDEIRLLQAGYMGEVRVNMEVQGGGSLAGKLGSSVSKALVSSPAPENKSQKSKVRLS